MTLQEGAQAAIRELRSALKLSQERLSRVLGVTMQTVVRYENRGSPLPPERLLDFAKLAADAGREDLAEIFINAFAERVSILLISCDVANGLIQGSLYDNRHLSSIRASYSGTSLTKG